ncbi:putative ribonuclease H-like domain-containing protein [Tanacetum coccineum]
MLLNNVSSAWFLKGQKASDYDNSTRAPRKLLFLQQKRLIRHTRVRISLQSLLVDIQSTHVSLRKTHDQARMHRFQDVNFINPFCTRVQRNWIVEPKNIRWQWLIRLGSEAMQDELHQFDRLKVWELVDKQFGKMVIKIKWLWKNKKDEDQTVIRNKARTCCYKGYAQEEEAGGGEVYVAQQEGLLIQFNQKSLPSKERFVWIKASPKDCIFRRCHAGCLDTRKKALLEGTVLGRKKEKPGSYICCQNHKLIADIENDIMDPVMQCTTLPNHSGFSQQKLVSFVTEIHTLSIDISLRDSVTPRVIRNISMMFARTFPGGGWYTLVFTMTNGNPSVSSKQHCGRCRRVVGGVSDRVCGGDGVDDDVNGVMVGDDESGGVKRLWWQRPEMVMVSWRQYGMLGNLPLCKNALCITLGPYALSCVRLMLQGLVTCHACGEKGHYANQCRKTTNNNAQGRAYMLRDRNAHQDLNVVTVEIYQVISKIAKSLTELTQKNKKYIWGEDQETAFQLLKQKLYEGQWISKRSTRKEMCTKFEKMMHKNQDKYVDEILKKFGFSTVKTESTPIETSKPLMKDENAEDVDVHLYRSVIISLMYLTSSRPDIIYLKGQPKLGLWYPKDSPFNLEAYTDSDYAGATIDRKSTIGGYQFLRNRLISWQCKKQTIVSNSTTEAEYVAAASCCGQVLWIQIKCWIMDTIS